MNLEFDYEKEKEKLENEKLEWQRHKKMQEDRINLEKEIIRNFENSQNDENAYDYFNIKSSKNNIIREFKAEKLEYENKIKDIETQIYLVEEEKQLFNNYKNECENQLNEQLKEIILKKSELETIKKNIDENYSNVLKREYNYISNSQNLEKKNKLINELLDDIKQKEIENLKRAKDISDISNNFDIKSNEIEINKKKLEDKNKEIDKEKEIINKEKKMLEAKRKDLMIKLESINLVGLKLYEEKFGRTEKIND